MIRRSPGIWHFPSVDEITPDKSASRLEFRVEHSFSPDGPHLGGGLHPSCFIGLTCAVNGRSEAGLRMHDLTAIDVDGLPGHL